MKITHFCRIMTIGAIAGLALASINLTSCASTAKTASAAESVKLVSVSGKITGIEKYGHCNTDVEVKTLLESGYDLGDVLTVSYDNGYTFKAPLVGGYDVKRGEKLVRTEYGNGYIAFCINYGKMNAEAGVDIGSTFTISLAEKAGYLAQYKVHNLKRTDERSDYDSDEIFANYRPVVAGKLYRGSHPAKSGWTRAPYVTRLMLKDGIQTIIDMADSQKEFDSYQSGENASACMKQCYENGNVALLSMKMDFTSQEFADGIVKAVRFVNSHPAPYYVHCNEGKDRTGFFFIFAESLLGWSEQAIADDYMQTYRNYYHLQPGDETYAIVLDENGKQIMNFLKGEEKTIKAGTRKWAVNAGLTEAEIDSFVSRIGK